MIPFKFRVYNFPAGHHTKPINDETGYTMEQFAVKPVLYFGTDALAALERLMGKRILLVTDGFLAESGLLDRITNRIGGGALEVFSQVVPDPPLELVAQGVERFRAFNPELLIAFGGGSPMDCAKAIRFFSGRPDCPFWCIPTTAGTGSGGTSFAVPTHSKAGVKYPLVDDALLPDAAVLDASLLSGVPPAVTADTGMDVLTHAAEASVARNETPFTAALAEKAFPLAFRALPSACRTGGEQDRAKEQMLQASCLAGIAFNGAGLGICHSLAHALGGRYHIPHGRLNAILLPHVIHFNSGDRTAAQHYAALARACGLSGSARSLAAALQRLRDTLGMPARLTDCGIARSTVLADADMLANAALADVCAPANPREAAVDDLKAILQLIL